MAVNTEATGKLFLIATVASLLEKSKNGITPLSQIKEEGVKGIIYDDSPDLSLDTVGALIVERYKIENGEIQEMELQTPFIDSSVLCRVTTDEYGEDCVELIFEDNFDAFMVIKNGKILGGHFEDERMIEIYENVFNFWKSKQKLMDIAPGETIVVTECEGMFAEKQKFHA